MQGFVDIPPPNSVILRATNAIRIDSLLDGLGTFLEVINSELNHIQWA